MPAPIEETVTSSDTTTVEPAPVSRRGWGKHVLLSASALAVLFASSKTEHVQAAPGTDTWKLGGNAGVNTDGTNFIGPTNSAPLVFKTANSERMRILPSGDVGINTTSPSAKFHIKTSSTTAVLAEASSTAANTTGMLGRITSTSPGADAAGVRGVNNGTNTSGSGVRGSHAGGGYGVYGTAVDGIGLYGTGGSIGVQGNGGPYGVYGNGTSYGVYGSSDQDGVYGFGMLIGVLGSTYTGTAIKGESYDDGGAVNAVFGQAFGAGSNGVIGEANNGTSAFGVWGRSTSGYAGVFTGNVAVSGTLTKGAGSFKIDHPLDPENQYLYHSFVESPDMMNIYNGNVTLDTHGETVVTLPVWFEALNMEFRYQLTCIGGYAPVYIAEEITGNTFKIAGGRAGTKVSWQVTGIRHDAFANAHRIPVEAAKSKEERGKYLHPTAFGKPASADVQADRIAALDAKNRAVKRPSRLGAAPAQ